MKKIRFSEEHIIAALKENAERTSFAPQVMTRTERELL